MRYKSGQRVWACVGVGTFWMFPLVVIRGFYVLSVISAGHI
ncbi:hypothetical protein [Proteus mirabilis]|nr:hypothetical protein [Proteus mirabilis]